MAKSGLFISCKFCNGERKISSVVNHDNSCNPHSWWNLGGISDNSHDVTQIRNFPKSSGEHSSDLWKQSVWGRVFYPFIELQQYNGQHYDSMISHRNPKWSSPLLLQTHYTKSDHMIEHLTFGEISTRPGWEHFSTIVCVCVCVL